MKSTLSSDAKVLLQLLLNNSEEWTVNLQFYSDKFKWNGQKQAKIVKELKDNGYLTVTRFSKGNKAGFDYFYTISEYGNLKPKAEATSQPTPEIQESEPVSGIQNNKESINQYMEKVNGLLDEYGKCFTISTDFNSDIQNIFRGLLDDNTVNASQYNEPIVRTALLNFIINDKLDWITSIIDKQKTSLHGSQANQKKYITETPKYFKRLFESGKYINDDNILIKLTNQKYSILGIGGKKLPDVMD